MTLESYAHVHHIVSNVSGYAARERNSGSGHTRRLSRRHDHGLPGKSARWKSSPSWNASAAALTPARSATSIALATST